MKTAVVEIGTITLLCPSVACASKLIELVGKTVRVRRRYDSSGDTYHREETDYPLGVEMRLVDASQIKVPPKRIPESKRLGYTPPLQEDGR